MFFRPQHVHFVGIGGIGMSGLAEVLLNFGFTISGSDLKLSPTTDRLAQLGAVVFEGHRAENVGDAKAVVITSAASPDNPEIVEARRRQVPVIPRGELLAELMRLKYGIAIAGSHGKTTTTSMTAAVLSEAKLDPTVVVGGKVGLMGGSNARVGDSQYLVVESDESDGSFLKLAPIVAVVTNIDREHLDHYKTFDRVLDAFADFINKLPFYGAAILCLDDEHVQRILPRITRRTITYGTTALVDLRIEEVTTEHLRTSFRLRHKGQDLGLFRVNVPGFHNVLNASAAVAVGLELGVGIETIRAALDRYSGVDRRFQIRGQANGITIIDDYGHHPTEIRATLAAARQCKFNRVHAIFQPHRYTRTHHLMDDFARSFNEADSVMVLDIYAASEKPIEGVTAEALASKMRGFGHRSAEYVGTIDGAVKAALVEAKDGDCIITLGAGNVWQAGEKLLELLKGGAHGTQ